MPTMQYPVRMARASAESVNALHEQLAANPHDAAVRHALAEEIERLGDEGYKNHLSTFHGHEYTGVWNGRDRYEPISAKGEADLIRNHPPDPAHTENLLDYWHPSVTDAHNYAQWETALDKGYSVVPIPGGAAWTILHHPEEFNEEANEGPTDEQQERNREEPNPHLDYSRIRYAQERRRPSPEEEESAFLEAIKKNPEDEAIRHAYADLLSNQGRHGEAAFHAVPSSEFDGVSPLHSDGLHVGIGYLDTDGTNTDMVTLTSGGLHHQKWMMRPDTLRVVKALVDQGAGPRNESITKLLNETPVRHAAYRAPKGGAVVRGTYYQGGKLIPDLEGDFANPPAAEQPVAPQYPVKPKRPSIKERLKAKVGPKPLVVSYARATPELLQKLMHAVRHAPSHDASLNAALADELQTAGRNKEAELVRGGEFPRHFSIDLNNGGRIVRVRPPRLNTDRQTRGVSHQQLLDQLQNGRSNRIGNNRTIRAGEGGDVHVLLHGNHVVTAHPNGEYSLFTQNYHTPTTFAVHREITGESPNRVRGRTMFRGQPFEEGVRFRPRVWNGQEWVEAEG